MAPVVQGMHQKRANEPGSAGGAAVFGNASTPLCCTERARRASRRIQLNRETRGGGSTGYESASKTRTFVLFIRCSPSKEEFTRGVFGAIAINPVGCWSYDIRGREVRIARCPKGNADKYADTLVIAVSLPMPLSSPPSSLLAFSSFW